MSDFTTIPTRKMQVFAVSYKSRSADEVRWTHTHYEHLPAFDYYFQDTQYASHHKTEHNTGTLNRNAPIVDTFRKKLREMRKSSITIGSDFWDERTQLQYERTLQRAIKRAITEVNNKFNQRFVQHIEQQITQSDPLYSFVKNGDNQ